MAKNKVFLNQTGTIEIEVVGDQNAASVELMGREIGVLITRLHGSGKPALILDNLLAMGEVDSEGRKLVVEFGKHLHYDKLAMVGKGGMLRLGTNLMLRAMDRSDKIHYFNDKEEALRWLQA